ncbi:Coproporphyrinogen III oxidase [Wolbachia endosymbiont of Drosophila simulans wNo]|nr:MULTISPECIES: oxygen-dependent coproporphyrinogen oxidase [unclassified Wolbachia]AGJ98980.1 Coproporphyrinogen III oxidase [Wolbachia endosymbiont of Drosophila simulans wNo]QCB62159.1 oxygen-dependent coproporphyrinogen oxidase [Wolbachia endosymbiont of Drosophila mauritiana]QCB63205.1 oxygen-dependent coproporphyrinogen oxidase [Wolbachia endosymbiont of Drosophila mauritiana]QWE33627.1 Coproporphyrinogen III oxidase [Wolbachia endosymbiont of Drosophila simulans]TGB07456.1 oxygen-depen
MEKQKTQAFEWFCALRNKITESFLSIEVQSFTEPKIEKRKWNRPGGGSGESTIIFSNIFEKVGVNVSRVYGKLADSAINEIPGASESNGEFWASGISLVSHMQSPLIPAAHMNTRLIYTSKQWFGGGMDFTPIYKDEGDCKYIHESIKATCDEFNIEYYPKFKKQCDDYFFLQHRKEPRGIGGIFYDNLTSGNWKNDFEFTKAVGEAFLEIYLHIIHKHMQKSWTKEQREEQLIKRGRYVEFNLLYDRGTRFGLMTNGNPDAIMMSMPPLVKWV